jgi:hypothetical protein
MTNRQLLLQIKELLHRLYEEPENYLIDTLAMMITGLFLGRHVQLWEIALWVPSPVHLTSIVRRFERFVADPRVKVAVFFEPFVIAMQVSLGNETAYLILDCTQAGKKCRTLMVALAYHGTALPIAWKTVKGKKGHVKGRIHQDLLKRIYPSFRYHRRVIVLGDAEFSNESVISWLQSVGWGFVLRFQESYLVQTADTPVWQTAWGAYQASQLEPGQVRHWENVRFTMDHKFPGLTMTAYWQEGEEAPWCLISNLPASEQPHLIYEKRFWIETLFGNHKSRGFELARTHMEDPEHIDRLVLAIAIATCITLGLATDLVLKKKTYLVDRSDRRDLSLFQLGWRWLYRLLALDRLHELKMVFRWDFQLPAAGPQAAS